MLVLSNCGQKAKHQNHQQYSTMHVFWREIIFLCSKMSGAFGHKWYFEYVHCQRSLPQPRVCLLSVILMSCPQMVWEQGGGMIEICRRGDNCHPWRCEKSAVLGGLLLPFILLFPGTLPWNRFWTKNKEKFPYSVRSLIFVRNLVTSFEKTSNEFYTLPIFKIFTNLITFFF